MQFGVQFFPDVRPEDKSAEAYFRDALDLAEEADRLGYSHVRIVEHYFHYYGGYSPNPIVFLAAAAQRTRRARLVTGAVLPAFNHPLKLAGEIAMLDAISGGRLDVGFARAYLPYEFASFGVSLDESKERFRETIRTVIRLWTEPSVTVETPFFAFRDAHSMPSPVQSPHPPVWGAAVRSAESFAWLGREGFNLLITGSLSSVAALSDSVAIYRKAFMERHGAAGKTPHAAVSLPLFIAPTDAEAEAECDLYLQRYLDVWLGAASSWDNVSSRDYPGYTGMSWAIRSTSPAQLRAAGGAVAGSPDHVAAAITTLRETLGVDQILWQIDFGAMPTELARQTLTRFIEDVAPRFA
jgi:alkanesulfonate monooxygenase SsuD/methylene tetrahydromethanopterin reductase-like flavin-dependent oxidoreductase (luciferase family)